MRAPPLFSLPLSQAQAFPQIAYAVTVTVVLAPMVFSATTVVVQVVLLLGYEATEPTS